MFRKLFALAFCCLLAAPVVSTAQVDLEEVGLPPELMDRINDVFESRYPPKLESIKLDPESPAADEAFTVTANLANDSSRTDDTTLEAFFYYSGDDGATWKSIEMDEKDSGVWEAKVPGQPAGKLIYYAQGIDTSGNTYIEMPCKVKEWPPAKEYFNSCAKDDKNLQDCLANTAPKDNFCMFSMSRDKDPIDDEDRIFEGTYDFWTFYAGQDDENLYFDIEFDGKPKDGTVSPMKINVYAIAFWNPDLGEDASRAEDMLDKGSVMINAPLATLTGGKLEPCVIGYLKGADFVQEKSGVKCEAVKNHLMFSLKKSYFAKNNPSRILRPIAVTANVVNLAPIGANAYDNSTFTNMHYDLYRELEIK